ncbi:TetR/AcrR family transcriptional regulator [Arsenicitalea aurantiaca]|nr:TetR/AcrR family transcriptional regulator [Arsenicitalea aurantiaca]
MQLPRRRSNADRSSQTREALLETARRLFIEKGYEATSTPEIVAAAGLTRGALYHHFVDKLALYRGVVEAEAARVSAAITGSSGNGSPRDALAAGAAAYLEAMAEGGRTHLLLVEAPAVLGSAAVETIDAGTSRATLIEGLAAALPASPSGEVAALAELASAGFDRAAIAIAAGADPQLMLAALLRIIDGLIATE